MINSTFEETRMNIFKAAYCRAQQFVFKVAIPFLPYRSPILLNSVLEVPELLKSRRLSRVLIVTDKAIHSFGLIEPLKRALEESGVFYAVFDETVPNPTIENVENARAVYLMHGCDALIGFGGGSAMDCAKIVGARIARPRKSVQKIRGLFKILKRLPFTIAIPTTAGTGSETTATALITDGETRHKFTINDLSLIPRAAVLDPEVTRSLPPHITAATGMDALTHAVEAYIGRSTVKSTRADAIRAVELISRNLENAYRDGSDMEARRNMLLASFYAGRSFAKSYVGYCHAVAHSLGGKYNTPHGLANAVLLPYVLEAYGSCVYNKLKRLAVAAGVADEHTSAADAARAFIEMVRRMNADMGIPEKLPGIRREDIHALSAKAEREANPFYPVPRLMTRKELEQFYYDVLED